MQKNHREKKSRKDERETNTRWAKSEELKNLTNQKRGKSGEEIAKDWKERHKAQNPTRAS